jgi:hypothetical protein
VASITRSGFQTIAADGTPTTLPGTTGASAKSFVVRNDGDLIIRGDHAVSATDSFAGLLIWSAADQTVSRALELSVDDRSEDDEMVIAADGTIYLTLLNRSEIVRVVDAP